MPGAFLRQIVLDTETTGLSPQEGHRITEIGCVEIINRRVTGNNFQTYLDPEREIDEGAARITGLSWQFLKDKPKFFEIVDAMFAFIGDAELIIHNAPFDVGFLNSELSLIDHECSDLETKVRVFDTLALARQLHPGQKNNLDALCKRYKVDNNHREKHGALLDSEILAEVYLRMTAGQTNFMLAPEENFSFHQNRKINKKSKISPRSVALKIVKASTEELIEHNKYLEYMKSSSDGICIWEQKEQIN